MAPKPRAAALRSVSTGKICCQRKQTDKLLLVASSRAFAELRILLARTSWSHLDMLGLISFMAKSVASAWIWIWSSVRPDVAAQGREEGNQFPSRQSEIRGGRGRLFQSELTVHRSNGRDGGPVVMLMVVIWVKKEKTANDGGLENCAQASLTHPAPRW